VPNTSKEAVLDHAFLKFAPSPARPKEALGPAQEPGPAGLNSSQPRPWAELQGDDPGGRGWWDKKEAGSAKTRCGAEELERESSRWTGPFYRDPSAGGSPLGL
jgi:hypothetical protein